MKKIGVLLSGCGVYDGAEIHEAVLTLLAIDQCGAQAVCIAPDVAQMHVVNHLTGKPVEGETRNVLVEAARIARGNISDIAGVAAADLDALILPGGFGAAKNLCTFAVDGPDCDAHPEVARLVSEINAAGKPLGLLCIAPAVGAKVLGDTGVELTIGNDAGTAQALEALGAHHYNCDRTQIHTDEARKVVSGPAYMFGDSRISQVAECIENLVRAVIERA